MEIKKELIVTPLNIQKVRFKIEGTQPLLMDKMPEDTLKAIEDKQKGISKSGKKLRNIDKEVENAIHKTSNGEIGFPAQGFLSALIECTSFVGDKFFSKKLLRGLKIVNSIEGLIPIKFKKQDILIHNIGSNSKHTPQFHNWTCDLELQFDASNISAQDIANLINYAGFYYGIGIWSPRCKSSGTFGMYKLQTNGK